MLIFFFTFCLAFKSYVLIKSEPCDVTVRVLASSVVDYEFESQSGKVKDYTIGMCSVLATHAALTNMSKDLLAWNQNCVTKWSDMSTHRLLFQ